MEQVSSGCVVCQSPVGQGLSTWHYICKACGYEGAALKPAINEAATHAHLDEADREVALETLRKSSFKTIVTHAVAHCRGGRLLDVGSAHGWFVEQASQHYDALGLEPDEVVCSRAAARGLNVRSGYFPDALAEGEIFDVIVFNDVIEHIPDIQHALGAIAQRLSPEGILILNLPNSGGFFYRVSKMLMRLGVASPFERMWQKGLPSPHVHYFNAGNLEAFVQRGGFALVERFELPAIRPEGLLERIRFAGGEGRLASYFKYLVIRGMLPFLSLFESDIIVAIFRKPNTPAAEVC